MALNRNAARSYEGGGNPPSHYCAGRGYGHRCTTLARDRVAADGLELAPLVSKKVLFEPLSSGARDLVTEFRMSSRRKIAAAKSSAEAAAR